MQSKNSKRLIGLLKTTALIIGIAGAVAQTRSAKKKLRCKKTISLIVGQKKCLKISRCKKNCEYIYTSNKPKCVLVTKSGKLKALSVGKARIVITEINKITNEKCKVGVMNVIVEPIVFEYNTISEETVGNTTRINQDSKKKVIENHTNCSAKVDSAGKEARLPNGELSGDRLEPAYGSYNLGSFLVKDAVKTSIPMNNLIKYGAKCYICFTAEQNTGDELLVSVGYSGVKYNKEANQENDVFIGESKNIKIMSGEAYDQCVELDVEKYMLDFSIDFSCSVDAEIKISNVKVTTTPFEGADYDKMLEQGVISVGNNERLKKVINKAMSGEDVTLAYIGGSITEGCAATDVTINSDCYAETSYNLFKTKFGYGDGSNVHFINAGMSGTPSSLGVIRYQNDVLNQMKYGKFPDVLFIEFVVNDHAECTNGEGIESLIRQGLMQGSAVFLVFAHTVNFDTGKQEYYIPLGEKYDLPMVSVKNSFEGFVDTSNAKECDLSRWFFWHDTLHPDVPGHRLMADLIMKVFDNAYREETLPDSIKDVGCIEPVYGSSFTGMTLLDANIDIDEVDAIVSLDVGDFCETDRNQNCFQYAKGGKKDVEWFPYCWMHQKGTDSFKATVKCSNMMIAYKLANDDAYGVAQLYVDGKLKETMNAYQNDGWNNATVRMVF